VTFMKNNFLIVSLVLFVASLFGLPAHADDVPIVDGKIWMESAPGDKRSFLIGVSNFIALEYAYQSSVKNPPSPRQSSVPDFYLRTENISLDQAIAGVDAWYADNPSRLDAPVLTVLWDVFVEPKL